MSLGPFYSVVYAHGPKGYMGQIRVEAEDSIKARAQAIEKLAAEGKSAIRVISVRGPIQEQG